jgi:hypothetical protein
MTISAGWSILGIASAVAIVIGIVLLVVYALQRGLVDRDLDGTDATDGDPNATPVARPSRGRTLGATGAVILGVGLGLGLLAALGNWSGATTGAGPGGGPEDCAQSWSGCPQATPVP